MTTDKRRENIIDLIIEIEGGDKLVDDPRDPGGLTKYGISQRAFPSEDIRGLTIERARELYTTHYWNPIRGDELPWGYALSMFDCAVNQGVGSSIRFMQRSLGINADGAFGPITLRTLLASNVIDVVPEFMDRRLQHYMSLPNYDRFGRGWRKRLFHISMLC
jgi:lysozyme family protein